MPMIYSLMIRIIEGIPNIKLLIHRLKHDLVFRLDCGFLVSDDVLSEASYSRLIEKIHSTSILETLQEQLLIQAFDERFLQDDVIAIDRTHIQAHDAYKPQEKKEKRFPKKRGRKSKKEKELTLIEEQICLKNTIYEQKIEVQLTIDVHTLQSEMPIEPTWSVKKNSDGKSVY